MYIRDAKLSEADLLSELAFVSKAYWGYSMEFMNTCREELTVSMQDISSEEISYRVYEINDEAIGFYAIEHISENLAELEALFVKPVYIGQGIGKALMENAISYTRNQGYKMLKIQGDPNAEKFYLASGAIRTGEEESQSIEGRYLPVFHLNLEQSSNT